MADFMGKEPTEIAAIWLKKAQKAGFVSPDKREYHTCKCNGKNELWIWISYVIY